MNNDTLVNILLTEALQKSISQAGGASRVTNNHFKYSVRGINKDKRNITTKRTNMRNTANMKGGGNGDSWDSSDEINYAADVTYGYTIDVRQDHLLLYAAEQIATKLTHITSKDFIFMFKIVYEMLVALKQPIIEILYTFKIPYKNMEIEINTRGLELENIIQYYPDAEAIYLDEYDLRILTQPIFTPLPQAPLVLPRSGSVVSSASTQLGFESSKSNASMEFDGGYSGINKKKHKSRKNKKTRRNTRRKPKKIRTRKNKQVRRKH